MLSKIIKIIGIGKFEDFQPSNGVELSRLTLIYSNNGRGKTTLSSILRGLSKGEAAPLKGRKSLNRPHASEVELECNGQRITYQNDQWSGNAPDIEVFDAAFIEGNICSGSTVEHDHKKNLCGFVLGNAGVQLAHKITALAEQIQELNQKITTKEAEVRAKIKNGFPVEAFVKLQAVPSVEAAIVAKTQEIEALKKANEIRTKDAFGKIILPDVPTANISALLAKELQGMSRQAEQETKKQIGACMDNHGEPWVQQGLGYVKDDKCPFCTQSLSGVAIIDAYKGYFSQTYRDLKTEIDAAKNDLDALLSPRVLSEKQVALEVNKGLNHFWQPLINDSIPRVDPNALRDTWNTLHVALKAHLEQKYQSPLDSMSFSQSLSQAIAAYEAQIATFISYNQTVDRLNGLIADKKAHVASGDLNIAAQELNQLENAKIRHLPDVDLLCRELAALESERTKATDEKEKAKEDLENYTSTFLRDYGASINQHLTDFGVDYRISEPRKSLAGGRPSISYGLVINGAEVAIADATEDAPCFANTLSSGDKMTLAFAFFLARLDRETNLDQKIIVFDDPICSLDVFRQFRTHEVVLNVLSRAKQVIVLSHQCHFLSMLAENCPNAIKDTHLQISRAGDKSELTSWDAATDAQSQDQKDLKALSDYLRNNARDDIERRGVARSIRTLIESHLRMRYTQEFAGCRMLGNMKDKIEKAQQGDILFKLQPLLVTFKSLNTYAKKYHHSNPNADNEPIDDTELTTQIKKAFGLLSELYNIH